MKEASFSLAEAKFTVSSDFNAIVLQNVTKAQIKVKCKKDNVAGVTLPVFECYQDGTDVYEFAGLARGGQQLTKLKKNYARAIQLLVDLASLQTSFITLDDVIKVCSFDYLYFQFYWVFCVHSDDKPKSQCFRTRRDSKDWVNAGVHHIRIGRKRKRRVLSPQENSGKEEEDQSRRRVGQSREEGQRASIGGTGGAQYVGRSTRRRLIVLIVIWSSLLFKSFVIII